MYNQHTSTLHCSSPYTHLEVTIPSSGCYSHIPRSGAGMGARGHVSCLVVQYLCLWAMAMPGAILRMCVSEAISAMLRSEPPFRLRLVSPLCILRSVVCSSDALQHTVVSCWAQKLAGDMDMSLIDLFVVEFMRRHPPLRACRWRRWRCPHRLLFS